MERFRLSQRKEQPQCTVTGSPKTAIPKALPWLELEWAEELGRSENKTGTRRRRGGLAGVVLTLFLSIQSNLFYNKLFFFPSQVLFVHASNWLSLYLDPQDCSSYILPILWRRVEELREQLHVQLAEAQDRPTTSPG